jgi:hypothetical protein
MPESGPRTVGARSRLPCQLPCDLAGQGWLERLATPGSDLEQDWTFVTRNSVDFRGPADQPGSEGQYANVPIHAGLICINGTGRITGEVEIELFTAVLDQIGTVEYLVNEVIEVYLRRGRER